MSQGRSPHTSPVLLTTLVHKKAIRAHRGAAQGAAGSPVRGVAYAVVVAEAAVRRGRRRLSSA